MRLALTLALALLLAAPAAARTPLTQARADREAATFADEAADPTYYEPGDTAVSRTELDPCDVLSSRRAECDGTYDYADGTACDFTVTIRTTRRDHLTADLELTYCDGD